MIIEISEEELALLVFCSVAFINECNSKLVLSHPILSKINAFEGTSTGDFIRTLMLEGDLAEEQKKFLDLLSSFL